MIKSLLFGLGLLLSSPGVWAQSKPSADGPALKTYQGEYKGGKATYTYYVNRTGERVRHGKFETVRTAVDFVDSRYVIAGNYTEFRETGSYSNGQRIGRWVSIKTEYDHHGRPGQFLPAYIEARTTTTETYRNGKLDGPVSYAEVPWKGGKPLAPTTSASAMRQTLLVEKAATVDNGQASEGEEADEEAGETDESTALPARATSKAGTATEITEYVAGPFHYDTAPSLTDPSHRPQSVRGYFDDLGYCDSTWTLHYFKARNERSEATRVEQTQGWMATTLWFSHGVLRREQTLQASTGELISKFALPASQYDDTTTRLVLLGEDAHLYEWISGREPEGKTDWHSPLPEHADPSKDFFAEATCVLGAPRLLNISFQLAPTAADSMALHQAENLLAKAHAHWSEMRKQDGAVRPADDTTGAAFHAIYLQLNDLLCAQKVGRSNQDLEDSESYYLGSRERGSANDNNARDQKNPYPWLSDLVGRDEYEESKAYDYPVEGAALAQRQLVAHMRKIQKAHAQVAARLKTASSPPNAEAAAAKP